MSRGISKLSPRPLKTRKSRSIGRAKPLTFCSEQKVKGFALPIDRDFRVFKGLGDSFDIPLDIGFSDPAQFEELLGEDAERLAAQAKAGVEIGDRSARITEFRRHGLDHVLEIVLKALQVLPGRSGPHPDFVEGIIEFSTDVVEELPGREASDDSYTEAQP